MTRKIDEMRRLYGVAAGRRCKNCHLLYTYEHNGRFYHKCAAYGISRSEATDWRLHWHACGLYVMGLPTGHVPVLERLKHRARGHDDRPIPGQTTMFTQEDKP